MPEHVSNPLLQALVTDKKAAPEITSLTNEQIQSRIDELKFALGYEYTIETTGLPPLREASYDKIYVNISGFKKVKRLAPFHGPRYNTDDVEMSSLSSSENSALLSHTDDEESQSPNNERDSSTLYVTMVKENTVTVLLGNSDKKPVTLKISDEFGKSTIISLLPAEGEESLNPNLLHKLYTACNLGLPENDDFLDDNAPNKNILLCSVRHYSGDYKTIKITAKDLSINEIPSNYDIDDAKDTIIKMLEKEKYANRGFTVFENKDDIILPGDYKKDEISFSRRLLIAALLLETTYTYLQYISSYTGWKQVIGLTSVALILSLTGTVLDFANNVWGILVDNDAIFLALRKLATMSPTMDRIASIVDVANTISFLAGGAGNALGVLVFMHPLYQSSPAAFYAATTPILAAIAYIGREYYAAFNIKRLVDSLTDLDAHLSAKKTDHDDWHERDIAITLWAAIVIIFRSVGFGGIAVLVALSLQITNPWVNLLLGVSVTVATAISILFTRVKSIVDAWSNNDFAYLSTTQKDDVWKEFTREPKKIINALMTLDTVETILMATGFLCMTEFKNNIATYIAASLAALLITVMCRAQIFRAINTQALKKLNDANINIKDLSDNREEKEEKEEKNLVEIRQKVAAADIIFATLQKPYLALPTENLFQHPFAYVSSIPVLATLFVGISVLNRGLGFLGYVDTVNSIMAPVITLSLDHLWQVIGLFLIFAPKNIDNMFMMFYQNWSGNVAQKSVERDIIRYNDNNSQAMLLHPFFASGYRRSINHIKGYVENKILELQSGLNSPRR